MVMTQPHLRVEISCLELCFSKCGPGPAASASSGNVLKIYKLSGHNHELLNQKNFRDETQQSVNCFSWWFWCLLRFETPARSLDHLLHGGRNFSDFSFFNPPPGDLHKCSINDTELTGVEIGEGKIGNYREEGWDLGLQWVLCWDCWQPGYKNRSLGNLNKGHFERKCRLSDACPYIAEHAQWCDPMVVEDFGERSVVESWRLPESSPHHLHPLPVAPRSNAELFTPQFQAGCCKAIFLWFSCG